MVLRKELGEGVARPGRSVVKASLATDFESENWSNEWTYAGVMEVIDNVVIAKDYVGPVKKE